MTQFYKMHGLSNDFAVFFKKDLKKELSSSLIKKLSNRRSSIGFDQLVILDESKNADIFALFYNADGSESSACGNATRCIAKLIADQNKTDTVKIETKAGIITATKEEGEFSVNLGVAKTNWQDIPTSQEVDTSLINLRNEKLPAGFAVNVGNPHLVFFVDNPERYNLEKDVAYLENNPLFPEKVNIELAKVSNQNEIIMRVWERGAGETLACGTGACAVSFAAFKRNLSGNKVKVIMPGGNLNIEITDKDEIIMTGAAELAYIGNIEL